MRASAIKSILIIGGAALGAALIGFLGAYLVLPEIAPEIATKTPPVGASVSDSTAQGARSDTTRPPVTSAQASVGDGTSVSQEGKPRSPAAAGKTPRPNTASPAVVKTLRDSIKALRRRLRKTNRQADTLREEAEVLREKLKAAVAERTKVRELSEALMNMRRRQLTNLLREVDMRVLKKLYQETSGEARTRLLQSMEPARAAQFINQVMEGEAADSASASTAVPKSALPSK